MKWLVGAAVALAVLAALALGAAVVLLPPLLASDATRARIEFATESALGRPLRYQALEFWPLPPSLVVVEPSLAGAAPERPSFAEARRVSLRMELLPLLARQLVVSSVVVDGATLRLRRSADGIELPAAKPGAAGAPGAEPEAPSPPPPLAVRKLTLRDSTLIFEDAAAQPLVTWELRDLDAKLRADSAQGPLHVEASFELASGGRARGEGSLSLAGEVDLELALEEVALGGAASYLGDGTQLAGSVTGTLALGGPARNPDRIETRFELRDADLRLGEIALRGGPLQVQADLTGAVGTRSGKFDIDASQAELWYGRMFRKPAGTPATVSGRIVSGEEGLLGFDDLKLKMRDLDASVEMSGGERMRMQLEAQPFSLAGWEALLPALGNWRLGGRVVPQSLALERRPTALHGRLGLDGVQAVSPRGGTLVLSGVLVGEGPQVRSEKLELLAEGQPVQVDARLVELPEPSARWLLRFETRGAELNRLFDGFTSARGRVRGRLTADGDLTLPVETGGDPLTALTGRLRFAIRDGSTTGRSLLKTSLEALIAVARPLRLIQRGIRPGSRGHSSDHFESVTGTVEIANGFARTRDLRISEREHSVDLAGTLRLSDLALDMQGKLTFADARDDEPGGVRSGIPIAHVGGTLGDPRVEVSAEAARLFATALEPGKLGARLEQAIDPETARDLADGLGDLLDKARRKRR